MVEETKQPTQQETQPAGASQVSQTAQPVQPKAQPVQTAAQPQPIKKKSKWWIWLIVGIVVLGIATAALFLFDVF
jgi:hypothetical protein